MTIDVRSELADWVDRRALDRRGEVFGVVVDVYDDSLSGHAKWLVISTGFFGTRRAIVPVSGASLLGDDVAMPHSKDVIVAAPQVRTYTAILPADERSVSAHDARHGTPPAGDFAESQHS